MISKQKEIFNELADERLEEVTNLDKKVNNDDLIYRYKGNTPDTKFDKFDNAVNIINKIQNGEISLADAKVIKRNLKNLFRRNKERKQKTYIKRAKLHFVQYLNALQSKNRGY